MRCASLGILDSPQRQRDASGDGQSEEERERTYHAHSLAHSPNKLIPQIDIT